jgi:hypothetical protein
MSVVDDQSQQLSKFRKTFSGTIVGEEGVKGLVESRRQKRGQDSLSLDANYDAAEELFSMLQAKDAFVPTRGKEKEGASNDTGKAKGGKA